MARRVYQAKGRKVGKTSYNNINRSFNTQDAAKITTGVGVPKTSDGKIGDITVRRVPDGTYRAYIKIESGWYDINAMAPNPRLNWISINLVNSWVRDSTAVYDAGFYKDVNGIVHLRGAIKGTTVTGTTYAAVDSNPDTITDSSNGFVSAGFTVGTTILVAGSSAGANNTTHVVDAVAAGTLTLSGDSTLTADGAGDSWTIKSNPSTPFATLPEGYRPSFNQYRLVLDDDPTSATTSNLAVLKIATNGQLSLSNSGVVAGVTLDGVSFHVPQAVSSLTRGQSIETSDIGHGLVS